MMKIYFKSYDEIPSRLKYNAFFSKLFCSWILFFIMIKSACHFTLRLH